MPTDDPTAWLMPLRWINECEKYLRTERSLDGNTINDLITTARRAHELADENRRLREAGNRMAAHFADISVRGVYAGACCDELIEAWRALAGPDKETK